MTTNTSTRSGAEKLDKWSQVLASQLARANTHLRFFNRLHACYSELTEAKDFWDYTLTGHAGMVIRDLGVIYDTHRDGVNLLNLLALAQSQGLGDPGKLQTFTGVVAKASSDPRVRTLRGWRNNIVAHHNGEVALTDREEFCNQHPLDTPMLQALVDEGFEIVEYCAHLAGRTTSAPRTAPGTAGVEWVVRAVRERRNRGAFISG
jgi:hypothetical protein